MHIDKQQGRRHSQISEDQFQQIEFYQNKSVQIVISQVFNSIHQTFNNSKRAINQIATNLVYNAKHSSFPFVNRRAIVLKPQSQHAVLMGKKYYYENREEFENTFHRIIWICYRSQQENKYGDVGWGCMIRVCQMVLAEALKRCHPLSHNSQIIKEFSASNQALFSFDKICMEGKIMKRWTSSVEIIIALQDLLKEQEKYKLKIQMYNTEVNIDDIQKQSNYPLLLIVNNRLGVNRIQEKVRDHLYTVLQHKNCIGMISGIGGQAIYIVGYHENQLIALDPHYVQSETEGQKKYFNEVPRGIPLQKLVPAAGFCFYFKNAKEHQIWVQNLAQSWYFHNPNVVIECQRQYSQNIYRSRHPNRSKKSFDSQQFEVLQ